MNNIPARYRNNLVQAAAAGIATPQPAHISLSDNRFTLVDAAGNERVHQMLYLDMIIADANRNVSKIFYDTAFTGRDDGAAPVCYSDNGMAPSVQADKPQAQTCAVCPNNAWGSAVSQMTGKGVKACRDYKKIAVVLPDQPSMIFQLRVPPASLKALAAYARSLSAHNINGRPADLCDAITRVEFESQGVIKFTPVGQINDAQGALLDDIAAKDLTADIVGNNDVPRQGALPAPAQAAPAAQPDRFVPPQALPPLPPAAPNPFQSAPPLTAPGTHQSFGAATAEVLAGQSTRENPGVAPRKRVGRPANPPAPVAEDPRLSDPKYLEYLRWQESQKQPPANPLPPPIEDAAPFSDNEIPAFLRKAPATQTAPAPKANGFGMQATTEPPNALQAALDAAMAL